MSVALTVVKVGGSLYDLADLQSRLRAWLAERAGERVLLVPGGGATADAVREFDNRHGLGEEKAHWLALRALALNASFLLGLLPEAEIVDHPCRACTHGAAGAGLDGSERHLDVPVRDPPIE